MCGQLDWNTDLKSEGAVNKSEFLQFVRLSMETVNEVVDGVCRLLRGVLSLCGAALYFF
uniref:Uncharacterized protein n=1 Tax=Anguilla anguilla TaxID=7936 RepID=A0A0E9XVX9_ANGAN